MKHPYLLLGMLFFCLCWISPISAQTGKSLTFNGTNQYMRIPHHADFNIEANESYTITLWIKGTKYNSSQSQRVLTKRDLNTESNKTGYEIWGFRNTTDNIIAMNMPNANGNHNNSMSVWNDPKFATPRDTWFHYALVVDRTTGKISYYFNGEFGSNSGSKDISSWFCTNEYDVLLGAGFNQGNPDNLFQGSVDNVRFYKKALSAAEIVADKTATVDASTEGLVAAYDFEEIQGLTVTDISGKGHNGTLVNYTPVIDGDFSIVSVELTNDPNKTGRGNQDEVIQKLKIVGGGQSSVTLDNVKFNIINTTALADITKVKVYATSSNAFDPRKVADYTLLGECNAVEGENTCTLTGTLSAGETYLWLTYDIAENANEGNTIGGNITSITTSAGKRDITHTTNVSREILLTRKLLYAPGDLGSLYYRIPAIVTAKDGSLVIATDKRKFDQGDLPGDIDILINRSTDKGKTWSEALTIAQGQGRGQGFGDAALVRTGEEGGLLCIFVGGTGLFNSTYINPIRTYICKSNDNGVTWSAPHDITDQLYGNNCVDPARKYFYGSFCASGAGLLSRDGVIYFVAAMRETSSNTLSSFLVYSEDNGTTWKVSTRLLSGGCDEAKITELNDGTLLVSVRNLSPGSRYYFTSTDKGATWSSRQSWSDMYATNCNGDIIYYTSTLDGYEKNRILHSVPNASNRTNVSVFVSYDEGQTWPIKKSICPTESAYSSLCILPDGTIGAYTEENYNTSSFSCYYLNFSLEWLTNGQDTYYAPNTVETVETPTFSEPTGLYDEELSVSIACATPDAVVYYTTNDETPTIESTVYENPITVSSTTVIKAIAMKEGMANSPIASATYTFSPAGKYCLPTLAPSDANVTNTFVQSITSTDATTNIEHTATARQFYTRISTPIEVEQGKSFTLNYIAKNLGDYSTTIVRQDLRYCVAVMHIDWNNDGVFEASEMTRVAGKLSSENLHNVGGNVDVLNISKTINVPENTPEGTYRCRMVYNNAWESLSTVTNACAPIKEGVLCDVDFKVIKSTGIQSEDSAMKAYIAGENIIVEGAAEKAYSLINEAGQIVERGILNHKTIIPTSQYAKGVYILSIENDYHQKLIIK